MPSERKPLPPTHSIPVVTANAVLSIETECEIQVKAYMDKGNGFRKDVARVRYQIHFDPTAELKEAIEKTQEKLRRRMCLRFRSIVEWDEIIQERVEERLRQWVGSVIWWDLTGKNYPHEEWEWFADKYVERYRDPEPEPTNEEKIAALNLIDFAEPSVRVKGFAVSICEWFDECRRRHKGIVRASLTPFDPPEESEQTEKEREGEEEQEPQEEISCTTESQSS